MYYIIENTYTGPNQSQDKYVDADTIEISTAPAVGNMDGEERTEGWCGTTNDWAVYAHGEYETLEEARDALKAQFGDVRDHDQDWNDFESSDSDVVEVYKPGKYEQMSREATGNWIAESLKEDISAATTDERIDELFNEYEASANSEGYTLDSDADEMMKKFRQELRDELEDESDDQGMMLP